MSTRYQVRGKGTVLNFDGIKIASASSRGRDARWVEFTLYRADTGQYIVDRVGKSIQYHSRGCKIVEQNYLSNVPAEEVPANFVPCERCKPSRFDPEGLFPERERPYFQTCDKPEGVIKFLEREDRDGLRYLTNVSRDLLEEASEHDVRIYNVYKVQTLS
jgi:hypothetical protein